MANISMKLLFLSTLMATRIHPLGAAIWKCVTGSHCFLVENEETTSGRSAKSRCVQMGGVLAKHEVMEAIRSDSDFADSVAGPCYWVDFKTYDTLIKPPAGADGPSGSFSLTAVNLIYALIGGILECTMMCDSSRNAGKVVGSALCFKSKPYICQRGGPSDPPISATPPRKKLARTRPKRHGPSKTVSQITTAGLVSGSPLSIRIFPAPTMCSRLGEATGGCKMFNYHMGTGECRAFAFKTRAREPGDGKWGAWEVANG